VEAQAILLALDESSASCHVGLAGKSAANEAAKKVGGMTSHGELYYRQARWVKVGEMRIV
jgi:hypothetical protein